MTQRTRVEGKRASHPLKGNGKAYRRRSPAAEPEPFPVLKSAAALTDLHLELAHGPQAFHLWNAHIDRYRYLG